MMDFEKECQDYVDNVAAELERLYSGCNDEIKELENELEELEDNMPEEPEQEDDESDEDFNERYEKYQKAYEEWENEVDDINEKIDDLNENGTLSSYFDDYLDVNYVVDSKREYRSAIICIGWGGPNVYIDTEDAYVKLYWGNTQTKAPISYKVRDAIDSIFEEIYSWAA